MTNTYSIRELSGASNIVSGIGSSYSVTTTTAADLTFGDDTFFGDDVGFPDTITVGGKELLLEASPVLQNLFALDQGVLNYDLTPYARWVEKVSIASVKNDPRNYAATIQDYSKRKLCTAVVAKVYEGSLLVKVGAQERDTDVVTWGSSLLASGHYRLDLAQPVSGRFISFRFDSQGAEAFSFGGFDYEIDVLGEF